MSILLTILLPVVVAILLARARRRRWRAATGGAKTPVFAAPMGKRVLLAVLLLVVLGTLMIAASPEPRAPADPVERAHRLLDAGLHDRAERELEAWVKLHPDSVGAHYEYVRVVLESRTVRERYRRGEEHALLDFYRKLGSTRKAHDAATFALGLCWSMIGDYARAVALFDSVANRSLPYLNNSEGYARVQMGMAAQAVPFFWKEIRLGHNVRGAVSNLADLALRRRDWGALQGLLANRRTAPLVPDDARRALLLHQGRLGEYVLSFIATYRVPFTWPYFLVALFGSLIWFLLIRWWDMFEKEPLWLCALTVLGGAVAANGVFAFHDVLSLVASVRLTGNGADDAAYFFAIVGVVEETVKLLPMVVVLLFTRQINEPMDWLVYACLSALGFSVWESYQYLSRYGLHVGLGRVFLSTPFHISLSGMLAMSIPEARHRGRSPILALLLALPVVAAVHGAFDFFILWNGGALASFSFCLALLWGATFIKGVGQLETVSPFRNRLEPAHFSCWPWFLAAFLTLCFITFAINASRLPHGAAGLVFLTDLLGNLGVLYALSLYTEVKIGGAAGAALVPASETA